MGFCTRQKTLSIFQNDRKMNKQEILSFLQNEEKRKDFIYKLQNLEENSPIFETLGDVMTSLRLNQKPRGIDQSTILKHTFTFCDAWECFEDFRLVSKIWKFSVEKTKFYHCHGAKVLRELVSRQGQIHSYPMIYHKFFQSLKKVHLWLPSDFTDFTQNFDKFSDLILSNVQNLRSITICWWGLNDPQLELYEKFTLNLLKTSNLYLEKLDLPENIDIPQLEYPNVSEFTWDVSEIPLNKFKSKFNSIFTFFPEIKILNLERCEILDDEVYQFILQNYAKHSIFTTATEIPSFPVKILSCYPYALDPTYIDFQCKFVNKIEYLQIILNKDMSEIEKHFENILNGYPNLKGIYFCDDCENYLDKEQFLTDKYFLLTQEENKRWEKRFFELKSKGIQILTEREMKKCEQNLCQDLGWGFRFLL